MNVESGMKIGDLVGVARRRVRVMIGVALVVSLAGYWITMALPNEYESYATVLVEPQTVDRALVEAGVPESDLNQRLGIMTANILSRSRLSRIIDDLHLYQKESEEMVRQEIIDLMRDKITVEAVVPELATGGRRNAEIEISTFRIKFSDRSDVVAKEVTERLANDFIEKHIEARVEVSGKSLDFIQGELDRLSDEIREIEATVARVKGQNPGRLPEEIANNQRRLERITSDLAFAQRAYSEARSDEAFFRAQAATAAVMAPDTDHASPVKRLQILELALTEYESKGYTAKHPDVIKTKAEIVATRERVENAGNDEEGSVTNFAQHNAEAEANRAAQRRVSAEEEIQRLENLAAEVQQLLIETPAVAEQLDGLERQYQHLFSSYQDFSNRRLEATVQAQLERRQLGEQFRVLEAAFVAPEPTSPNRPVLFVLSVMFGLAVGAAAGILAEATDTSIHDARQLQNLLRIPVLAAIPQILLESDRRDLRRRRIRTGLATLAVVVFALVGGAASYLWVNGTTGLVTPSAGKEAEALAPAGIEG
jgi:succinoglycan biosynthesis transport protein ExoP